MMTSTLHLLTKVAQSRFDGYTIFGFWTPMLISAAILAAYRGTVAKLLQNWRAWMAVFASMLAAATLDISVDHPFRGMFSAHDSMSILVPAMLFILIFMQKNWVQEQSTDDTDSKRLCLPLILIFPMTWVSAFFADIVFVAFMHRAIYPEGSTSLFIDILREATTGYVPNVAVNFSIYGTAIGGAGITDGLLLDPTIAMMISVSVSYLILPPVMHFVAASRSLSALNKINVL